MRALMQSLRVLASASQPSGDGGMSVAEDSLSGGRIQPGSRATFIGYASTTGIPVMRRLVIRK